MSDYIYVFFAIVAIILVIWSFRDVGKKPIERPKILPTVDMIKMVGIVQLQLPPMGELPFYGKVSLKLPDGTHEFNAIGWEGTTINKGEPVEVIAFSEDVLFVRRWMPASKSESESK